MSESPEDYSSPDYSLDGSRKRRESLSLPLPPGALPPRKRAKTAIEKEQRRVERILRNRQAAQSSREKKRKQLEELESINLDLRSENSAVLDRLAIVEAENKSLRAKLDELSAQLSASKSSSSTTVPQEPRIKTEMASSDFISTDKASVFDSPSSSSLSSFSPASGLLFDSYSTSPEDSSDIPATPDALDVMAFKSMHHPAAVMSLLDLQRHLKNQPLIWGPWMVKLASTTVMSAMILFHICSLTFCQMQLSFPSPLPLTAR